MISQATTKDQILEESTEIDTPCPKCETLLYLHTFATAADDFINTLICPNCDYEEKE